jgi:hypothetical protein
MLFFLFIAQVTLKSFILGIPKAFLHSLKH